LFSGNETTVKHDVCVCETKWPKSIQCHLFSVFNYLRVVVLPCCLITRYTLSHIKSCLNLEV